MSEYIITCDEETASWVGNDVDAMRRLVRCRDCSYYNRREWNSGVPYYTCNYFDSEYAEVEPDGFCKWGERK